MTDYDFRTLSPVDFEHLARDVLNADLDLRLQSYAAGRDQGIDLRQIDGGNFVTVAQCKHYPESSESTFLHAVAKEGLRGKSLVADRYLFVTSRPLTPPQQDKVRQRLAGLPVGHDDIWGQGALNGALGRHPEVERRHIKLWIPSTEVLGALLNAGQWQRSEALLSNLADRAKVWVHTAAYDEVLDMLEREGVCIVSGPPGVGKSLLAGMVLLATAHSGWQVVDVTGSIEEAWTAFKGDRQQIFYYDDFLGEAGVELTKNEPRSLNAFLDRVRQFKDSKRILLTTREYELRRAAEGPADKLAELARRPTRYSLRLDVYDVETRAKILFNHLYFSDMSAAERDRLALDNQLISIVEHPSYSPRIVADAIRFAPSTTASETLNAINRALVNPQELMNASFRGLSGLERQILLTVATLPNRPQSIEAIRRLVAPEDALAWTPALHALETTWLQLTGPVQARSLSFVNPGCRDYLLGVLDDTAVAEQQLDRVASIAQLVSLARTAGLIHEQYRPTFGAARAELASVFTHRGAMVLDKVKQFTTADLQKSQPATAALKALLDAAALSKALGSAATSWLLDLTESVVTAEGPDGLPAEDGFELAEAINELPRENNARQVEVARGLALASARSIATLQDLDAFEALPTDLAEDQDIRAVAADRARTVITAEYEQLRQATNDAEAIKRAALDLDHRAKSYGIEIEIGSLLDHADDLAANETHVDWPDTLSEDAAEQGEDLRLAIHQLFVQLGDGAISE